MSARRRTPAADADRQLLQRASDAFDELGNLHTAISAQCGDLWQLAYSQGSADDQGRIEALLICLEKLDSVVGPMICELADALDLGKVA